MKVVLMKVDFWLKPTSSSRRALLSRVPSGVCCGLSFILDSAQGMEFSPSSRWLQVVRGPRTFSSLTFGGTQCVSRSSRTPTSEDIQARGRPWCGDGRPDVSAIPPMPNHLQGLEEWLNFRNCEL